METQSPNFYFIPFDEKNFEAKIKKWFREVLLETLPQQPEKPDIISIQEASEITGLTVKSIYDLVYKRKIPYLPRNGRKHLRFSRGTLIKWQTEKQG